MLGRKVSSGLARLPLCARLPFRTSQFQCPTELASRTFVTLSQHSYASPGRPRKTVGEPSRPVKRAVKREAKKTTGNDEATTQLKAKKRIAAAKKKAAPKKKAKKPVKRQLTEDQKIAAKARLAKLKTADLRKAALKPPHRRTTISAYNAFFSDKLKGAAAGQMQGPDRKEKMSSMVRPVIDEWKSLSPAELEHYNHLAQTRTEAAQAEYKTWVESHSPESIALANRARAQLRRTLGDKAKRKSTYQPIKDERSVKRPASSFIQFSVNRQASGDFRNIPVTERMKLIAKEWRALSEGEKKKYKDLQSEDINRYSEEYNSVYGHLPPGVNGGQPQAAAAAA